MKEVNDNNRCFVCGTENPIGIRMQFEDDPVKQEVRSRLVFAEEFQGWEGHVHGGIQSTVLDEIMVRAAMVRGLSCVTGEMSVRFIKPVFTGTPCLVTGRITEDKGRLLLAEASIQDTEGQVLARATAKLFRL
jgi:uncharacterized protein (TIGR00369 family)